MKRILLILGAVLIVVGSIFTWFLLRNSNPDSDSTSMAELTMLDGTIYLGDKSEQFSGKVVLRDDDLMGMPSLMAPTRFLSQITNSRIAPEDLYGLVLKVDVVEGVPQGKAEIFLDLQVAEGNRNLKELFEDNAALSLATTFSPRIQVGEATLKNGKVDGPVKLYYPNPKNAFQTQLILEGNVSENLPDSVCTLYHKNGKPRVQARFEKGQLREEMKVWYASGQLEREIILADDGQQNKETRWYENGQKAVESIKGNSRNNGQRTEWYISGQVKVSEDETQTTWWFPNGIPKKVQDKETGLTTEYYSDETIRKRTGPGVFEEYPRNGTLQEFHNNGEIFSEMTYDNDTPNGPYKQWYSNGTLWEEGTYDMGTQVGRFRKWWKNGTLAEDHERKNGRIEGQQQKWYDTGELWEQVEFQEGKKVGLHVKFWNNGQQALECTYDEQGQLQGTYKRWYPNAVLWEEATYVDGKRNGPYKKWFKNKQLAYQFTYKEGRIEGEYQKWYPNGTLRLRTTYLNGKIDGKFENWLASGEVYELANYQKGKKTQSSR